jgi:LPXTG-site transpeptidase (sortase) family protein
MDKKTKKNLLKFSLYSLEILAVLLFAYIIFFPFYPGFKYMINSPKSQLPVNTDKEESFISMKSEAENIVNHLTEAQFDVSPQRLIIDKIGVNVPIVESKSSEYGLSRGAWRDPQGSTPDKGGNTIITGHRFKYLPPSNLTFYLFDKLQAGDTFSIFWDKKYYFYKIKEVKIVDPTDLSILAPTKEPTITMYTCNPIYSQKERLVVIGEKIVEENSQVVEGE